ncbi:MAG: hypothetical protein IJP38_07200 [Oscillospiraceae bacterium]|nr:hypothetical protein [Oscillospiraceae bacterium]
MIIILVLPSFAWILSFIPGQALTDFVVNVLDEISIFEVWINILANVNKLGASLTVSYLLIECISSFFEVVIISLCVHLFLELGTIAKAAPPKILFGLSGVITGSVILTILPDIDGNLLGGLIANIATIVIMILGIKLMFSAVFKGGISIFSPLRIIAILAEGVFSVLLIGYVATLLLITGGAFVTLGSAIISVLSMIAGVACGGYICYILDLLAKGYA